MPASEGPPGSTDLPLTRRRPVPDSPRAHLGILSELATSPGTSKHKLALRISVERLPLGLMLDVLVDERLLELTGAGSGSRAGRARQPR